MHTKLDLLRYNGKLRAIAQLFWYHLSGEDQNKLKALMQSAHLVRTVFPSSLRYQSVIDQLINSFSNWNSTVDRTEIIPQQVAHYLFETLTKYETFVVSELATHLKQEFIRFLETNNARQSFNNDTNNEHFSLIDRYYLVLNWLHSFIDENNNYEEYRLQVDETAMNLLFDKEKYVLLFGKSQTMIKDLKGNHPNLTNGTLTIQYHEFINRLSHFSDFNVPHFNDFITLKETLSKSNKN